MMDHRSLVPTGTWQSWCIRLLPLLALGIKVLLILEVLYVAHEPIASLGFGFGGYVQSLLTNGSYRSCGGSLPFHACDPALCVYATRMPALPLLYFGIASLVAPTTTMVALLKALLMTGLLMCFVWLWVARVPVHTGTVLLFAIALLGPQVLKHASAIDYEEGVITELMICYAIAIGLVILSAQAQPRGDSGRGMCLAAVVIACLMYLSKTTILPLLALTGCFALFYARSRERLAVVLALVLTAVPTLMWARFTQHTTGRATVSSSWNGENLLRGNNALAPQIYPDVSLDRVFDSPFALLDNGTKITLPDWSSRQCFRDEWSWNDFDRDKALDWIRNHPLDAGAFALRKGWAFFVDIQPVPRRVSATDIRPSYGALERFAGESWMLCARLAFAALIFLILRDITARKYEGIWVIALVLIYAAPSVAAFTWQRHVVPVLCASLILLALRPGSKNAGLSGAQRDKLVTA